MNKIKTILVDDEPRGLTSLQKLLELNCTEADVIACCSSALKPVDDELLVEAVKRAGKRIEEKTSGQQVETFLHNIQHKSGSQKMKLCIPSLKGFQVVEIQDIIYCEANSNYTNFHFVNRPSICASKPIHEYEELLEDCGFVRVHKSFVVNLEHVNEYIRGEGGTVMLSNGYQVEVSRRKKDLLMKKMKEYYKF